MEKDQAEFDKAENDRTAKQMQERRGMVGKEFSYKKKSLNEFRDALIEIGKFQKNLDMDAVSKAEDSAQQQIDQFDKMAKAAFDKADAIEDAANKEKAIQKTTTSLLRAEADLRINILKTIKDGYRTEFDALFDMLKEMGQLSESTLLTFRAALEAQIPDMWQQVGAGGSGSMAEIQRFMATS